MDWNSILAPALAIFGSALATWIVAIGAKWLKTKTGIELDVNQQKQAKEIVLGLEEKALALLKKKKTTLGVVVPTGSEKHADAVEELKVLNPELTTKEATGQIDRAVGSLPTVGAMTDCHKPLNIP